MYLKTLTIRGFKSFASATTLRLEPGITCVVGPNGSGKSNIVDALAWVMGEQGAKSLRGANMADVIFAGTSGRPALGRAQVELTIDNSDGRLPIEYSEVTIARTLFRGGGSEYTINGSPVRLLDVQELLSDTGMGKQMHVIVGQGQLDAVLRASPQERREFIDEAAGVLKHRRRKERTLRKLGAMDADLLRVVDLTEEIRRQLRPLARQARAARAAKGIHDRIRDAQLRLGVDEFLQSQEQLERDSRHVSELREAWTGTEESVREIEKRTHELETVSAQYSRRLAEITEIAHQFDSLRERLNSSAALTEERIATEHSAPSAVSEASVNLAAEKLTEVSADWEQTQTDVEAAGSKVREAENVRAKAELNQTHLAAEVREAEESAKRHWAEFMKSRESELAAIADVTAQEVATKAAIERHLQAEETLEAVNQTGAAGVDPEQETSRLGQLNEAYRDAEQTADRARASLENARERLRAAEAELVHWNARAGALKQTLTESTSSSPNGVTLDSLVGVRPGWEIAVSALLQEFERAAVRSDLATATAELDSGGSIGKASVFTSEPATYDELGCHGQEEPGPALHFVSAPQDIVAALRELLADAWLAPDTASARSVLASDPAVNRVATPQGVVMTRHTLLNGSGEAPSALELRSQWEEAATAAEAARAKCEEARAAMQVSRDDLDSSSRTASLTLQNVRAAEQEWARSQQQQKEWARQRLAARSARDVSLREMEVHKRKLSDARKRAKAAASEAVVEPEQTGELGDVKHKLANLESRLRDLREHELQAKLALSAARERERAAGRQVAAFRTRYEQLRADRVDGLRRDQERSQRLDRLRIILARVNKFRDEALISGQSALAHKDRLTRLSEETNAERTRMVDRLERLRWAQVSASEQRQQAEVAIAGATLRRDRAKEELLELLHDSETYDDSDEGNGVSPELWEQTLLEFHPDRPMLDDLGEPVAYSRSTVWRELQEAQKELQRLGVVNPLAVTEYEALQDRHKFLEDQVGDLRKSKRDLLEIISDVDQNIKVAFEESFADTQKRFSEVFAALFPGGTGKLSLTDPDDPLETGVEIYARPAGKRVTRLSLLSGGERSLAALAYLVAIFRARPSPFYVMDEVEAALDDVNLTRVLSVMDQLRQDSQLIMVTHQKRTMEIADALYGVSMREGMTTVVSHRM